MILGLFQYGISISGAVLRPGAYRNKAPERTKRLAALSGCPTQSTKEMIQCLKTRPANIIVENVREFLVLQNIALWDEMQI